MLISVPDIFTKDEVRHIRHQLDNTDWVDGRSTAGFQSARVKDNAQLPESLPLARELGAKILQAIEANPLFVAAALPRRIFPPLFNRYAGGQSFGDHIDNSVRRIPGNGDYVRTDLSVTLFFSEPDEYDGGELVVRDTYGDQSVKLPAGHLVLYPSRSLHHVNPVTRGARVSSFFWLQSFIRDDSNRSLLLDLDLAIQRLAGSVPGHASLVSLTGIYHNLIRTWAEA